MKAQALTCQNIYWCQRTTFSFPSLLRQSLCFCSTFSRLSGNFLGNFLVCFLACLTECWDYRCKSPYSASYGFQGSNSGCRAWIEVLFPTETFCWSELVLSISKYWLCNIMSFIVAFHVYILCVFLMFTLSLSSVFSPYFPLTFYSLSHFYSLVPPYVYEKKLTLPVFISHM